MAKPKAFNVYLDGIRKLDKLTDEQAGRLFKSLSHYADCGELPDFSDDPLLDYAFVDFAQQIDRDFDKYDKTCEKRRENGKLGGAPVGNSNAEKQPKQANGCLNKQNKQMVEKTSKTSQEEKEEEKEEEYKEEIYKEESASTFSENVKNCFNEICVDLPKVRTITETRKHRIKRARELIGKDIGAFKAVFTSVQKSDFLSGKSGKWRADFDWILEPRNLTKIVEGVYDNRQKKRNTVYSADNASFDISQYEGRCAVD